MSNVDFDTCPMGIAVAKDIEYIKEKQEEIIQTNKEEHKEIMTVVKDHIHITEEYLKQKADKSEVESMSRRAGRLESKFWAAVISLLSILIASLAFLLKITVFN